MVFINWHDSVAFCRWLSEETGQVYRLPTEAEWEKAARGSDGRIYPWGNEWDKSRCNTSEGGPNDTTSVGVYPEGASPYGVMGMVGNVWEWCATKIDEHSKIKMYPYDVQEDEWTVDYLQLIGRWIGNYRMLRGGSWFSLQKEVRCAARSWYRTSIRLDGRGFRLVSSIS